MDSAVLGLTAVAWTDSWNAAAFEGGLRLPVDPSRLLDLLRGLPVARALLSDLQQAVSAGRSVELIVSPDRQIAEIATGSGHYVLTAAARNSVLAALLVPPQAGSISNPHSPSPTVPDKSQSTSASPVPSKALPGPGVLWESPTAATRDRVPPEAIPLAWLGANAYLEVRRDGGGGRSASDPQAEVHCATLRLQLPRMGRFDAEIRVCGNTVAVSIDCANPLRVGPELAALQQRLSGQGLVSAHVGLAAVGRRP
jgi:hypothetical protein